MADGIKESRLSIQSEKLRESLVTRNLFVPYNEYPDSNGRNANNLVNSINSIIGAVAPFKSYNLKNTVYGRLVTNPSPLTEFGLAMLGVQFTHNFMSNLAQQTFPTIKVANLFDGSKDTKLFSPNIDFRVTRKEETTNFENFLDRLFFRTVPTPHPSKDYPFTKNPSNADFIKNSGYGQLGFLYTSINKNVYKQDDNTLITYGDKVQKPIQPRSNLIAVGVKTFYNFADDKQYPYLNFRPITTSIDIANKSMIDSYNSTKEVQEYAPDIDFVEFNFGQARNVHLEKEESLLGNADDKSMNGWISDTSEFGGDVPMNKVVWGRDGTTPETDKQLSQLQGLSEEEVIRNYQPQDLKNNFNIRTGLLEYTRNLVNATEGRVGDITRKAFVRGGKLEGFNGSGLWRAPSTALPEFAGRKGVRQHSALDQYDRFAKAIRFNGNKVYSGNENSVIFNSVLPRIHPTLDQKTGKINNKNLMFSIENLAVRVISKDNFGIIDDEYGSPIPACEVGPFNGRIMWFPPYNLEFNETASAKFEPTVMIGRNEPMYNYMYSERGAQLNFTLLVDYPEQLKSLTYQGVDKQKAIAEFFAFGGGEFADNFIPIEKIEEQRQTIIDDIFRIQGSTKPIEPEVMNSVTFQVAFPNDLPKTGNINGIFDEMYKTLTYEILDGFPSSDGSSWGLNKNIYYITGVTGYTDASGNTKYKFISDTPPPVSQYNLGGQIGQYGSASLNKELFRVYNDEKNRKLYSVYIYGGASKLYTENIETDVFRGEEYNLRLGKRRADATINLVKSRLRAMFGKSAEELGIEVTYDPEVPRISGITGSVGDVPADGVNATKVAIPLKATKEERKAIITIKRNNRQADPIIPPLSEDDIRTIQLKLDEVKKLDEKINAAKRSGLGGCFMNERGVVEENGAGDTGILHGFQSISNNYYYPTFHTQTPEDFHRRLTFLQQCVRQGAAIRKDGKEDETGIYRARNSVFGRQPICILRIGDFFYTKIIIENVTIDYADTTWDMNPEGFGMQPMIANVTLQIKIIGGQSLKGPIDALQNAVSFNYYANSTYTDRGMYKLPSNIANEQDSYIQGILTDEKNKLNEKYKDYKI